MSHTHSSYDQQAQIQASQAYVIEVGETQAGLVNRRPDERYFTFIAASAAFHALEGHRFATPGAAELAARQLAAPRRHSAPRLAA
ncbi:hypothetical protein [Bosea psychrotolerans]|uniref:Uncharacterized protein n=1 Tax=Bosea psychrotolerans TaxID=1871628 RepID=A0A2S4LUI6_9HYPH|nr:hypothetical protein [Bosea psychrotolerans]POR46123.1 hypothetical protein CYD53_12737 [Bosea psychrotolerans]